MHLQLKFYLIDIYLTEVVHSAVKSYSDLSIIYIKQTEVIAILKKSTLSSSLELRFSAFLIYYYNKNNLKFEAQ